MVLEDRGVKKQSFLTLQNMAVADARTIHDNLTQFRQVLRAHSLGTSYRLSFIIERFIGLGLKIGPEAWNPQTKLDNAFLGQVRHFAMTHVLRDIKHGARIKIPNSWLLVGVADEGPAYAKEGYENVYILPEGKIFGASFNTFIDGTTNSTQFLRSVRAANARRRAKVAQRFLHHIKKPSRAPRRQCVVARIY
jgi:RNA-dependent RNA polymerase